MDINKEKIQTQEDFSWEKAAEGWWKTIVKVASKK